MSRIDPDYWQEEIRCRECGARLFRKEIVTYHVLGCRLIALTCKACAKLFDVFFLPIVDLL